MLWIWGGDFYNIGAPEWLNGPMKTFFVTAVKSSGDPVYMKYPMVRIVIFAASIVVGVAMWLLLNRTRIGMLIRAGVDNQKVVEAIKVIFVRHSLLALDRQLVAVALRPFADQADACVNADALVFGFDRVVVRDVEAFVSKSIAAQFPRVRGLLHCLIILQQPSADAALCKLSLSTDAPQ